LVGSGAAVDAQRAVGVCWPDLDAYVGAALEKGVSRSSATGRQSCPHTPFAHTWPVAQAVPALEPEQAPLAPQWVASVRGSTHALPQTSRPDWQVSAHAPFVHTWPTVHAVPALAPEQSPLAPQWVASVRGFTHVPPHTRRPAWQGRAHAPFVHTWPTVHAVPALAPVQSPLAPQWVGLVRGSTQAPLQARRPDWQVEMHAPFEQCIPTSQELPQAPQLRLSIFSSTQTPPQVRNPPSHEVLRAQPASAATASRTGRKRARSFI
jgi:hypothetical protein